MNGSAAGILLLVLAGAMNSSFTLPMKFTRKWAWENTWLAWTIFALLVFPGLLTWLTVPRLGDVYAQTGMAPVAIASACGAAWGAAQACFGLAVEALGIALAFSVTLGISAVVGALIPLFTEQARFSAKGLEIIGGVALVSLGVLICAWAGHAREAALGERPKGKSSVGKGLLFCAFSGCGSALVGLGLRYSARLADTAQQLGADPNWKNNAAWLPLMLAGAIPNLIYCLYLLSRNRTSDRFKTGGTGVYWLLAAIMAFFWFASTLLYGIAYNLLGVVAWPAFMSLIVITAMIWGVVTGEWKSSGISPLRVMYGGLGVLVLSIVVLSLAKS